MNIWDRYDRALKRASAAHTEGDTTHGDIHVFQGHALAQRDHVAKLQSKIARQSNAIRRLTEVKNEAMQSSFRWQTRYRALQFAQASSYGMPGRAAAEEQFKRLYWHSFDWTKVAEVKFDDKVSKGGRHELDAYAYVASGHGKSPPFAALSKERAEQLREQMRDAFGIFNEPVKPTLRDRIGDAWVDLQFWLADRLEDAAEWLRVR